MNIQSEIRDYILSHDFVMLPGVGAFVAEYSKPYFDLNGEIVPAERKIRFNPHLRNDSDVEILQVFKERMNISDAEVQEQYFSFLDTVNEQLAAYNRYYWDGFGILLREGPQEAFQFLPFQPSVSRSSDSEVQPVPAVQEDTPSPSYRVEETYTAEEPEEEPDEEDEPEERSPEGNRALKYLIFTLPLVLLTAALVYMVFFKPSLRENVKDKPLPDTGFAPEEVTVDTLYSEPAPQVSDSASGASEPSGEEHVVRIGIYKRVKDADKIVAFLSEKGYSAKIRPHGPLFKVYLVAETEGQAIRYVKEVEQLIDDTPIYERKKNNG